MMVVNINGQGYVSRKGMRAAAEVLSRASERLTGLLNLINDWSGAAKAKS